MKGLRFIGLDPAPKNFGFVYVVTNDYEFKVKARFTIPLGSIRESKGSAYVYWAEKCNKLVADLEKYFKKAQFVAIEQQFRGIPLRTPLETIQACMASAILAKYPNTSIKLINSNAIKSRWFTSGQRVNYEMRKAEVVKMCETHLTKAPEYNINDRMHDQADALLCALLYYEMILDKQFIFFDETAPKTESLPLKKRGRKPAAPKNNNKK